ncbi:hypothetical protein AALA98_15965 [Lachnospiraceae bacterium 45-W7]
MNAKHAPKNIKKVIKFAEKFIVKHKILQLLQMCSRKYCSPYINIRELCTEY